METENERKAIKYYEVSDTELMGDTTYKPLAIGQNISNTKKLAENYLCGRENFWDELKKHPKA